MIKYCQKTNPKVGTILVECGGHFARDLVVQETGLQWLERLGMTVLCTDNDTQFLNPSIVCVLVRQMLGVYQRVRVQADSLALVSWLAEGIAGGCR